MYLGIFRGLGRAELWGGFPSSLKFLPRVGLGGGVKFLIYFLEGGGGSGQSGNPSGYTLDHLIRSLPEQGSTH